MQISISIISLILSGALSVFLGFMWYGPLFGKAWMRLTPIAMPDPKPSMKVMIKPMIQSFVLTMIMAYVLSYSLYFSQTVMAMSGVTPALASAFWIWLGFMVPVSAAGSIWEGKSWKLFAIHAGYWLVLLMGVAMIVVKF